MGLTVTSIAIAALLCASDATGYDRFDRSFALGCRQKGVSNRSYVLLVGA
jgi:hypothetical protein